MGRRTLDKNRDLDPKTRSEYLAKLKPFFIEKGMSSHSMDAIAQYLEVSKATFYKHFHSRDELFDLFVSYVVEQILEARYYLRDKEVAYEERLLNAFAAILQRVSGIGFFLLADLRNNLPALWDKIREAYSEWEKELDVFFSEGIERGHVNDVSSAMLAHMVVSMSRELMRPEYLQSLNCTLAEAFADMFKILIRSIIKTPEIPAEALDAKLASMLPEIQSGNNIEKVG